MTAPCVAACALLAATLVGSPALAASSLDGGAWAQTAEYAYGNYYYYGIAVPSGGFPTCTPDNCGPGHVFVPDGMYAAAELTTAYGAMSGSVSAIPPVPSMTGVVSSRGAKALDDGRFTDHFTLNSASVPAGTHVDVLLTVKLSGSTAHGSTNLADPGAPTAYAGFGLGPDYPQVALSVSPAAYEQVGTAHLDYTVGSSFDLTGVFILRSVGDGLQSGQWNYWQSAEASAQYFVDVLTPGVGYSTESGHSYISAVPEPQTWAMLLAGLGWVSARARRWRLR